MKINRFLLLLAAAGWVWVGAASARDVRNDKIVRSSARPAVVNVAPVDLTSATEGAPTDPTECERHCADNAEHVFKDCMGEHVDPPNTEEQCARRAHEFLERCLKDQCNQVPDCVEQCHADAGVAFKACMEEDVDPRNTEEDCAPVARQAFEDCIAANCPPPPLTCEQQCHHDAEGVFKECMSRNPSPGEEACLVEERDAFGTCVHDNCMIPPSPTCLQECENLAGEVFHRCMNEINNSEVCGPRAHQAGQQCVEERCQPEPPDCEDRCKHAARRVLEECMAEVRPPEVPPPTEEECARRARNFLAMCLRDDCHIEPPCEEICKHRADEAFHTCVNNGGDPDQCAADARGPLNACLANCHPPDCVERCRADAENKFNECMAEVPPPGVPPPTEGDCAHQARAFLESCLIDRCHRVPPCEDRCRMEAADDFRDCMHGGGTIEACAADVLTTMNVCIASCGQPQTCEDACRERAVEFIAHCIVETGNIVGCAADGATKRDECLAGCTPP